MRTRLIHSYKAFIVQHPHFPLLDRLQNDIIDLKSDNVKNLPKDQQRIFCVNLLWLTQAFLSQQNLEDSALGRHISHLLKTMTKRFSESQLRTCEVEHKRWITEMLNENCPTSTV